MDDIGASPDLGQAQNTTLTKSHKPVATHLRPPAAIPSSLRASNLSLIMTEIVASGGGISRSELAARTGLTPTTVSRLANELLEAGMVSEGSTVVDGRPGRPGRPLYPAAHAAVGIGLEVNVDKISGCAIDLLGNVVYEFSEPVDGREQPEQEVLIQLGKQTAVMIDALSSRGFSEISAIYLAVPSIVGNDQQTVIYASNLEWNNVRPIEILKEYIPEEIPFIVENDANLQAIASASALSESTDLPDSFLYVFGNYGVGGALVQDGRIARGANGWSGEIGHMVIDPNGERCHCSALGCLETFAGRQAMLEKAGLPLDSDLSVLLKEAQEGNPSAVGAIKRAGWALGIALTNAVNLLDVNHVILGNGLGQLLPWMRDEIERQLDNRLLGRDSKTVNIEGSLAGPNASATGGALEALQSRVSSPMP